MQQKVCQKWDLNPRPQLRTRTLNEIYVRKPRQDLESGALDRSAILTCDRVRVK